MLDARPLPETAAGLAGWIADHPDVGDSPGMAEAVAFLSNPPLRLGQRIGYRLLAVAAIGTMPDRILRVLGLRRIPGARTVGTAAVRVLRWALGSSPSWRLALRRMGAPEPDGLFVQPLPVAPPRASA